MAGPATPDLVEIHNLLPRLAGVTDVGTLEEYLDGCVDDAVLQIDGDCATSDASFVFLANQQPNR